MGASTHVTGNATDTGRKRDENQDYFGAYENTPYGDLWVVCDGMGGASGGRTASVLAVEAVRETLLKPGQKDPVAVLLDAIGHANSKVYERSQADPKLSGMGTTLVALLIQNGQAFVAHVGDSRVYLHRDGHLQRLTKDHTMVQEMLDEGLLTATQAEDHPDSHIITRSVGIGDQVKVDIDKEAFSVREGDRWVLCTDGLTGQVSDELICSVVADLSPAKASRTLVNMANETGGPDNITIQVVEIRSASSWSDLFAGIVQKMTRRHLLVAAGTLIVILIGLVWLAGLSDTEVTEDAIEKSAAIQPTEQGQEPIDGS